MSQQASWDVYPVFNKALISLIVKGFLLVINKTPLKAPHTYKGRRSRLQNFNTLNFQLEIPKFLTELSRCELSISSTIAKSSIGKLAKTSSDSPNWKS